MPATRMRCAATAGARRVERLDLLGREEEAVPDLALVAEVAAGVVLDRDRELHDALHALDDLLDDRGLAVERDVEDVRARAAVAGARGCGGAAPRRRP